ncbi:MAG: hypothetical protein JWM53_5482 [bacterium]|nr:hypothetical protein [bacterium]
MTEQRGVPVWMRRRHDAIQDEVAIDRDRRTWLELVDGVVPERRLRRVARDTGDADALAAASVEDRS